MWEQIYIKNPTYTILSKNNLCEANVSKLKQTEAKHSKFRMIIKQLRIPYTPFYYTHPLFYITHPPHLSYQQPIWQKVVSTVWQGKPMLDY